MERIACLMGRDLSDLKQEWSERIEEVHSLTEDFFAPDMLGGQAAQPAFEFDEEVIARWKTYPALRSSRAVEIFNRLRPELLRRLSEAARPGEALLALDGFLAGLPAGVQVFRCLKPTRNWLIFWWILLAHLRLWPATCRAILRSWMAFWAGRSLRIGPGRRFWRTS